MAGTKFNREHLKKALLDLDLVGLAGVLADVAAPDSEHAEACVDEFKRSGCAVVRHPAPKKIAAREAVVGIVRAYINGFPDELAQFEAHVGKARLVEVSFHDILATIESFEIAKRPPEVRAWACIKIAVFELETAMRVHEEQRLARDRMTLLNRPSIETEPGRTVSVDAVVWSLVRGVGQNLQMLGYQQSWFEKGTGDLILPSRIAIDEDTAAEAGLLLVMELVWTDLINGWDRVRFFEGSVKSEKQKLNFDNRPDPVEVEVLEFGPPTRWELFDAIAVSRLEQNLVQHALDLGVFGEGKEGIKPLNVGPVPLPEPGNFISAGEVIAFHFMEEVLLLPIREDGDHAGGLSLKQWLRGYAFIGELCQEGKKPMSDVHICAKDDLVSGLCQVGFTDELARAFIRHVTYGRSARDLMDDPLVRLSDGNYLIFAPGYRSPALARIVMSRLGRFQTEFSGKGKRFETAVLREFTKHGIEARSFKYKVGDVQYDCDVAVLWGRTLFVLECKNHSLAFGHIPSLSNFHGEFFHAAEQAVRIMGHFVDNPALVTDQFGADASWDQMVGCVMYATPWAIGPIVKDTDLFSYDASALGKLLGEGRIAFMAPRKHGELTVVRRHQHKLWKGDKPDEEDLLRQLRDPIQLKMARAGRGVEALFRETAPLKGLVLPSWIEEPLTLEKVFLAMGIAAEEAEKIAENFEEFHTAADAFDARRAKKANPGNDE